MAILINKTINYKGINLDQLYLRFEINSITNGKNISARIFVYTNKISFNENSNFNRLDITPIPRYLKFDYDRLSDGTDILSFIHDKLIEYLSTNITRTNIIINEDTGKETTETAITNIKFCEPSEISIIDID